MCGRYQLIVDDNQLGAYFDFVDNTLSLDPKQEIFPSNLVPVITDENHFKLVKWGFSLASKKQLIINSRLETVREKWMFKEPFEKSRVLVVASAFFEWDAAKHKKIITVKDAPLFSMAGILRLEEDQPVVSILTRDASDVMAPIHDRMPVIFNKEEAYRYLHTASDEAFRISKQASPALIIEPASKVEALSLF